MYSPLHMGRTLYQRILFALALLSFLITAPTMAFEFECKLEKDSLPPVSAEADALFLQARKLEKQRYHDKEQVTALYEQAAKLDHWKALHNLARRYRLGLGTYRSAAKTLETTQRLIELGAPIGYYDLAVILERGYGVKYDIEGAWLYLHKAAKLGEPNALIRLGNHYGYNLPREQQQNDKAAAYFKCAAQQQSTEAYFEYADWLSVGEDRYPESMHYYQLAVGNGMAKAAVMLDAVFSLGYYQYEIDEAQALIYQDLSTKIRANPELRISDITTRYPLPPHPVHDYGSLPDPRVKPTSISDKSDSDTAEE
ncbi:tetratricopeptide repeat protein [Motilimonas sp. 1_MG-2023]|uniref:tetratricopeptide repeat protein n=1 Tax=Motilimonas sp. 1_MG-2023 TaxID=3062672 RepID=UPI0026E458C1|nr:tetratricopeptide repeat protein [Motilimonas sp. 1_MG-2023]MDO6528209.1 tetratricopeptide repeat protein [Motilimonas sp. 1_MG-2023]